jgi:polysaccharide chain length determinant protein (PEP-CTERM system associated)
LRAAEESRDSYKRELAGEAPVFVPEPSETPRTSAAVPEIDARLATLQAQLDALLRRYTDEHPDVVGTRRIIEQLEEQRRQELLARSKAVPGRSSSNSTLDRNPVFQQLRVSLADAEANVASLRSNLSAYEAQYSKLKAEAQLVPQVEAEFQQINRDYDIQKKTYETLLQRRQSAAIGEGVQDAGGTQFRVVDPPRVAPQPVPPTRISLLALALGFALVTGLIVSFATSEIMPTFHDARSVREVTQRPILGMVTMLPSEELSRSRRRTALYFSGGLSGLVAGFAAVFALALLFGGGGA